jgi:hypothetical protein
MSDLARNRGPENRAQLVVGVIKINVPENLRVRKKRLPATGDTATLDRKRVGILGRVIVAILTRRRANPRKDRIAL